MMMHIIFNILFKIYKFQCLNTEFVTQFPNKHWLCDSVLKSELEVQQLFYRDVVPDVYRKCSKQNLRNIRPTEEIIVNSREGILK